MLFVDANRESYGVEPICRMLPSAPSTYYEQKAREKDPSRLPARAKRDVQLRGEIRRVRQENFGDVKKLVETCISDSWSCSRFTP